MIAKLLDRLTRRIERLEAIEMPRLPVLKELRLDTYQVRLGSSAPVATARIIGASGSIRVPCIQFSPTLVQEVYMEFHAPSDLDPTKPVHLHLMWQPSAGWTTGNYSWKFEYLVKNENGSTILAGTPTTIAISVTPANATTFREDEYPDNITLGLDQVIMARFYRDTAADNANQNGEVRWWELEYTSNRLGEYF